MPTALDDQTLRFGDFELQPAERVLRVRGEPVSVGSRAFDLLLALAERHGRLVTKQELLDLVWPGVVVEEHNIATQISSLRKLLGAQAIATIPGRGYRLVAASNPPADTAPGAATAPRHNLPDQRTRFIGRETALAGLARLLPATRLLTLVGIGGCGKTRLATQFAHQQVAAYADGVWFVDLAPLHDAERVASTCAAVLGVREEGDAPLVDRLLAFLANRRALVVLDNCEHVLDGVAALVDALLGAKGDTTVLATSREALGLAGEQVYPVQSLSSPVTAELPAVLAAESVRVFVDRARLVLPEFEVTDDNAAPVTEICRRLDGIALAIELAAGRVTMLSVAEIAERLDHRFRLLTGGSRALPRHKTLETAMQWSYDQLAPREQRMLRQMSVFAGGWTLQAAADVAQTADEYDALSLLTALHDKSLLVVDRTAVGSPRYRMLETVRQYAEERLNEVGEAEAARGRHLAHFVDLAETAEPHLRRREQDVWYLRLRREHDNLIAALEWRGPGHRDPQSGMRLVAASNLYWVWNSVEQGHRLARWALDRDLAAADSEARVGALRAIAKLSTFRGRYEDALSYAEQALEMARRIGRPDKLALALDVAGSAAATSGLLEESVRYYTEALALARTLGDESLVPLLLNNLAEALRRAGQMEAAGRSYREGLELARVSGGRLEVVVALDNLIRVEVALRRLDEARALAIECLPLARGQKIGIDLLETVVGLATCFGDHATAARFWGAWDQKMREWGYRLQPVDVEHTAPLIAEARRALGDAAFGAAEAAGRALAIEAVMDELERWLGGPAIGAPHDGHERHGPGPTARR